MNRNFKMFSLLTVVFSMMFVMFSSQVTYAQQSVIGVIKWGRDAIKTGIAPCKTKDFIRAVSEDEVTDYSINKAVIMAINHPIIVIAFFQGIFTIDDFTMIIKIIILVITKV